MQLYPCLSNKIALFLKKKGGLKKLDHHQQLQEGKNPTMPFSPFQRAIQVGSSKEVGQTPKRPSIVWLALLVGLSHQFLGSTWPTTCPIHLKKVNQVRANPSHTLCLIANYLSKLRAQLTQVPVLCSHFSDRYFRGIVCVYKYQLSETDIATGSSTISKVAACPFFRPSQTCVMHG